ncbi:zinc-binding dehydrogenase [Janibacter terrae]|uniref:Zinc-binding dehydrogenase n=1 Tax=Janibacter terrae TaxID=103817 RepID=A0ABZ2FI65_9MICO
MRTPTMLAVRTDGAAVTVEEVRRVRPATGEVLVRVGAVAVDRRDGEHCDGHFPLRLDPRGGRTLGRHVTGTVAAPGAGVDGWPLGRPVALQPETAVRRGWHVPGVTDDGGLAEYVVAPAAGLVPLPRDLPLADAAQLPLAARAHSMLVHARLAPGEGVGVWGAGSLGACAVAVARSMGAAPVVVVDPDPVARATSLDLGADLALDPDDPELDALLRSATAGRGLDVALHAAPDPGVARAAVDALAADGRAVLAGPVASVGGDGRWDGRTLSGPPRTSPGSLALLAHLVDAGRLRLPVLAQSRGGLVAAADDLDLAVREQRALGRRLVVP